MSVELLLLKLFWSGRILRRPIVKGFENSGYYSDHLAQSNARGCGSRLHLRGPSEYKSKSWFDFFAETFAEEPNSYGP